MDISWKSSKTAKPSSITFHISENLKVTNDWQLYVAAFYLHLDFKNHIKHLETSFFDMRTGGVYELNWLTIRSGMEQINFGLRVQHLFLLKQGIQWHCGLLWRPLAIKGFRANNRGPGRFRLLYQMWCPILKANFECQAAGELIRIVASRLSLKIVVSWYLGHQLPCWFSWVLI